MVSDVVDAVKHRETNVMTIWNSRKLELAELDTLENKFFVRVPESEKQKAQQLFAVEREVRAEGIEGEYAFFTRPMTEGDFALAAAKTEVISRIRAEI